MSLFKKKKIIVTHNGTFHADDLFACATVSLYFNKKNKPFKIIRTRDKNVIENADVVFDVGGVLNPSLNRFDHHQKEGAGLRNNTIPYASFGLSWKYFGLDLCNNEKDVWEQIDKSIASPVDATDNGVDIITPIFDGIFPYSGAQTLLVYSPTWKEDESKIDEIFLKQVKKAAEILSREIKVTTDNKEAEKLILNSYNKSIDKRLIELTNPFPRYLYQNTISRLPEPIYLLYPGSNNTWKVEAVSKSPSTLESRKLFPESWRGFMDGDIKLKEATGVQDVIFCHRSGFLIAAKSKEGAIALANKALLA